MYIFCALTIWITALITSFTPGKETISAGLFVLTGLFYICDELRNLRNK